LGFPEVANKVQGSGRELVKFAQGVLVDHEGLVVAALPGVLAMELEF